MKTFFSNLLVKKEINERDFKKKLTNIIKIVHLFANDPLIAQEDVLKKLDVSKNELIESNLLIIGNKNLQDIILKMGSGERYWNSILPFKNIQIR